MTLLNAAQKKAIQAVRHRATMAPASGGGGQPFIVENVTGYLPPETYEDEPTTDDPVQVTLYGDISWRDRFKAMGSEGGVIDTGRVVVVTQAENYPVLQSGSALIIDGKRCEILDLNRYDDTGDLVVNAVLSRDNG